MPALGIRCADGAHRGRAGPLDRIRARVVHLAVRSGCRRICGHVRLRRYHQLAKTLDNAATEASRRLDLNEEPTRRASVDTDRTDRFGFVGLRRILSRVGVSDESRPDTGACCVAVAQPGAQSPKLVACLDDVRRAMKIRMLLGRVVVGGLAGSGIHNPRGALSSCAKGSANASCRLADDRTDRPVRGADALALQAVENLIQRHSWFWSARAKSSTRRDAIRLPLWCS